MTLDWLASALLIAGYAFLPRAPRVGVFVIAVSDVVWCVYAAATSQLPLFLVSAFCGIFSLVSFVAWRPNESSTEPHGS